MILKELLDIIQIEVGLRLCFKNGVNKDLWSNDDELKKYHNKEIDYINISELENFTDKNYLISEGIIIHFKTIKKVES